MGGQSGILGGCGVTVFWVCAHYVCFPAALPLTPLCHSLTHSLTHMTALGVEREQHMMVTSPSRARSKLLCLHQLHQVLFTTRCQHHRTLLGDRHSCFYWDVPSAGAQELTTVVQSQVRTSFAALQGLQRVFARHGSDAVAALQGAVHR